MNDEIEMVEKQIQEIKGKYANKLIIDWDEVYKHEYELELEKLKERYNIDQPEENEDTDI